MRIGYSVEGSTDRALIKGLKTRWCPHAELIEGRFRGSTGISLRREFPKICEELAMKGADVMIFLTDANGAPWRQIQENEKGKFPEEHRHRAIHGVPDRNVECWLCADPFWIAGELQCDAERFRVPDPKGAFERAVGITRDEKQEIRIADIVNRAPLWNWFPNRSFEDFYEQIREYGLRSNCQMENLRDRGR